MSQESWLEKFGGYLVQQDLADSTIRSYCSDVMYFHHWLKCFQHPEFDLAQTRETDMLAYRQYLVKTKRFKAGTVNRRLQVIKQLFAWAERHKLIAGNPTQSIRFMRRMPLPPPVLNGAEVHALLCSSNRSPHFLAKRNHALLQLMLQAGLRVTEIARIQYSDLEITPHSGVVRVVYRQERERKVPLNATARHALSSYIALRQPIVPNDRVFCSERGRAITDRAIQRSVATLVSLANIQRIKATPQTLRHTFAARYLQANPGSLVELAILMGHASLNTTAIYTQTTRGKLAQTVENSDIKFSR
jgi:site-specific recombinase XerD